MSEKRKNKIDSLPHLTRPPSQPHPLLTKADRKGEQSLIRIRMQQKIIKKRAHDFGSRRARSSDDEIVTTKEDSSAEPVSTPCARPSF